MNSSDRFKLFITVMLLFGVTSMYAQQDLLLLFEYENEVSIQYIDWSYDSSLLAIADANDVITFFDSQSHQVTQMIEEGVYVVRSIKWQPENRRILIANNATVIWDYDNVKETDVDFPLSPQFPEWFHAGEPDWNPNGQEVAFVIEQCDSLPASARVEIWNIESSSLSQVIDSCIETGLASVEWHPSGEKLALIANDMDGEVSIWSIEDNEELFTVSELRNPHNFTWSASGDEFAIGLTLQIDETTLENNIQLHDATNGMMIMQFEHNFVVSDWHPFHKLLVTGTQDGVVNIWDMSDGMQVIELPAHADTVNDVSWSPDGSMLASVGRDGRLYVWDVSELSELDR
jgi:WD40 repeat protein